MRRDRAPGSQRPLPLWLKVSFTAFVAVLVPVYHSSISCSRRSSPGSSTVSATIGARSRLQTMLALVVLPVTYLLTDPSDNINWVFGPGGAPQQTLPPLAYLGLLMAFLPLAVYLPTHLLFTRVLPRVSRGYRLAEDYC